MNKLLLLNAGWLAVAAGAYYFGTMQSSSEAPPADAGKQTAARQAATPAPSPAPVKSASAAGGGTAANTKDWLSTYVSGNTISTDKMAEAVAEIMKSEDPVAAMQNFTKLLSMLTPENAEAAYKAVRANTRGPEGFAYMNLLSFTWGQKDGKAALAALTEDGGREGGFARGAAVAGWASSDPDAAIAHVKSLKEAAAVEGDANQGGGPGGRGGRGNWELEFGLVNGLAKNDPSRALDYIMTLDENQRDYMSRILVDQKLKEGVDATADWALALTDKNIKSGALETVARQYQRENPEAALAFAEKIATEPGAARAVGEVADSLAEKDPGSAIAWANKLPAGDSQTEAYRQIYEEWTRNDVTAASTSLSQMSTGPARDAAIKALAQNLPREDAQAAVTWTGEISDPAVRLDAQIEAAQRWNAASPEEAKVWIAQNIPAESQAKALAAPQEERGNWGRGGRRR